ncbi:MAG: hypothetical protein Q8P46_00455 [Hyphomicrobiales bacterium]|nr:hypothetical protein [Hyphomicrobiales bacterium]
MAKRRIALIGTSGSGVHAPFAEEDWQIWGVSARAAHVTRADRWFEMHRLDGEEQQWAATWRATLKGFAHNIPELVMLYPEPDLAPNVTQYPYQRIVDRFGTFFMTSSFAWMMALALDEMVPEGTVATPGACEIAIFGVEMEYGTEYRQQRSGFRHFIDVARVLGVGVTRLASGGLAYEPVPYPLWQDDPLLCKLAVRQKATRGDMTTLENSLRVTRTMIAQNKAMLGLIEQSLQSGFDAEQRMKELHRELDGLMDTSARLSQDIVRAEAKWEEQQWVSDYLAP